MTLGDKIRKYRLLHNKTQKQLGEAVGFKKSTADVRINQYETNKMAPKADIRTAIAAALDIDIAALSDINLDSFDDIMYVFFELEEQLGMNLEKKDGKTYLSFDDGIKQNRMLITYLNIWENQKNTLLPNPENTTVEQIRNYELWKSRFAKNIREYFELKESEIEQYYSLSIDKVAVCCPYARKTSDITILLRKIIEAGFTVSTTFNSEHNTNAGPGFTFIVNELLNPPSPDSKLLFAQFRSELNRFSDLGAECYTEMLMIDKSLTITYYIPVASFSVIKTQIDELLEYLKNNNNKNDFSRDTFEMMFKHNLEMHYNYIEEEIELHKRQ